MVDRVIVLQKLFQMSFTCGNITFLNLHRAQPYIDLGPLQGKMMEAACDTWILWN